MNDVIFKGLSYENVTNEVVHHEFQKILLDLYTPGMPSTTDFLKLYHVVSSV